MDESLASVDDVDDIDALLQRLADDESPSARVVEQVAARVEKIRPEQLIRRALELAPTIGMTLINLLPETRLRPDFSDLEFDPVEIGNPVMQIALLRYLAQADVDRCAELLARFLDVPDKVVQMEALKALGNLQTDFDPTVVARHIEQLSPRERSMALEYSGGFRFGKRSPGDGGEPVSFATGYAGSIEETRADQGLLDIVLDEDVLATRYESRAQVSLPPSLETIKSGRKWMDRYLIRREIGRGAMGKAVLAEDGVVDELVVLKFMRPDLVLEEGSVERFRREVKYARRIGHRNVIRVHDLLIQDRLCAISMEYFESRGLDRILQRMGALGVRNGLKILYQIANGMAAAHEQAVVHRDLKPSNILIGKSGLLKIVDFGIASVDRSAEATLTNAGAIVGSPAYLAPERVSQETADERSDIYSLGIVGYYIFAGRLPYDGELHEILNAHQQGKATPLTELRPDIPGDIAGLVAEMMAVNPAQRPASMLRVRNRISSML